MQNDIITTKKLLPQGYADAIEQEVSRNSFPWNYVDNVTFNTGSNNDIGQPGLSHLALDSLIGIQSEYLAFFKPIIYHLQELHNGNVIKQLLRLRIGLINRMQSENNVNIPHVDFMIPHYTACYYVNDSDGDTVIYNEMLESGTTEENIQKFVESKNFTIASTCSPRKNHAVIFNGHRYHSSSHPLVNKKRIVMTINYTIF
jgi:hypothetical protein